MENNGCQVCKERISNPVCIRCYVKEVGSWLQGLKIPIIPRKIIIQNIYRNLDLKKKGQEKCILCKKGHVSVCSYCFFSLTEKVLKRFNFPGPYVSDFKGIFNYDIMNDDHTKKELESLYYHIKQEKDENERTNKLQI